MKEHWKRWWPICKWLLAAIILIFVGVRIIGDLRRLDRNTLALHPGWLLLAAVFYLIGLGFSGWFWYQLLWVFDQQPRFAAALRAYYISHLGKYVPGKALALIMRGSLVRSERVNVGVAVIAAFYEVMTLMAAGALVAAVLFSIQPPQIGGLPWNPVFAGLLLLGLVGLPLMPAVFNRLVQGLARKFQNVTAFRLPVLRSGTLLRGLLLASAAWALLGLSLWALLQALLPRSLPVSWQTWISCTAMVSLSYVAGFLAIVVPGGVGVREYVLLQLLPPVIASAALPESDAEPLAAVAVIVLRLLWTLSEVTVAGILYWWRGPAAKVVRADSQSEVI